ncbi:lysylphosphatidylglycerol synthase transmembrane domain-containing protein [Halapricum salinum]|uniref:TIGR00374 family protein n=1 Tax=Halapricum salinum TaxID=1457250 RepID=A0A4D6HB85_9EURY|nr:lysylphosphatidylglycerol synthase transmembrane domain-containing protein [Halapricum salinum]QCC50312.1 TIGR00374 family protein [Halapricum salinum]
MDGDRWITIALFIAALLVLGLLVWLAGVEETISALERARLSLVAVVLALAVFWLASWGMSLYVVLDALGHPISAVKSILVFSAAMFANNITPFGQAGGEPVSAFLISEAADTEYENGLAAIASVDTLHFMPSIGMAFTGVAVFALDATRLSRDLYLSVAVLGVLLAVFVLVGVSGYRYRHQIEHAIAVVVTPILRLVARVIPGREPPSPEAIEHRIDGFFGAIERIASDREAILKATTFSAAGWVALSVALWVAVSAVGGSVPLAAALIAVPIGSIAGVTPLPGGSGAIETAFAAILVSIGGILQGTAVAAVLVHRIATYWLPTIVGGLVAASLGASRARTE